MREYALKYSASQQRWVLTDPNGSQLLCLRLKADALAASRVRLSERVGACTLAVYTKKGVVATREPISQTHGTDRQSESRPAPLAPDHPQPVAEVLPPEQRPAAGKGLTAAFSAGIAKVEAVKTEVDEGKEQAENINHALEWVAVLLPLLLGPAATAALLSASVQEAAKDGWLAVFLATLTWSLGVGLTTLFVLEGKLQGYNLVFASLGCFIGASVVSGMLGIGYIDVLNQPSGLAPPLRLAWIAKEAVASYGFVGALMGAAVGVFVGYRAMRIWAAALH